MSATPEVTTPKPAEGSAVPEQGAAAGAPDKPRGAVSFVQERFKGLVAEYGPLLFVVYFSIFGLVFVGSALLGKQGLVSLAQRLGFDLGGTAATAGAWTAAYLFTKVLQPLRIAATIALTPLVAAVLRRFRKAPVVATEVADAPDSAPGRQS